MKTLYIRQIAATAGLLGVMFAVSGSAMAANYNIILKDAAGEQLSCATGGFFNFNKSTAGSFPIPGASVTLGNCPTTFVPSIANGPYTGTPNVVVENVTLNKPGTDGQNEPLNQGPNVVGLTGTLQYATTAPGTCAGTGNSTQPKTYTIAFAYAAGSPNPAGRTYTITCEGPGSFTPITGQYHVRNLANPIPEPQMLWLALAGLGALVMSRRIRRRRS
jgi:hypothetical protein